MSGDIEVSIVDVRLEAETQNLLEEVSSALVEVNKHRPFDSETKSRIATAFLPDRVTASLNIEGIAVSRRQTLAMMDAMFLTDNHSKAELEIFNALKADEYVVDCVESGVSLTASTIREINGLLQNQVLADAGVYRTEDVEISGASFQPPSHLDVPELVRGLVDSYNSLKGKLHPLLRSVWLHASFTHIHPFVDGNGRTGRLLQDLCLMSDGYFPTGIPSAKRDDYYDALEQADGGNWNPLCQMVCQFELEVISKVQSILDEIKNRGHWVQALAKRAHEKKSGTLHKQYIVWRQRMSNIVNAMEEICVELSSESDEINIRSEKYNIIDFDKWNDIKDTGSSSHTWALKQNWYFEGELFYKIILYFRRHYFRSEDLFDRDKMHGNVAMFITGGDPTETKYNFDQFNDREIRFRELCYVDDSLQVYTGTSRFVEVSGHQREIWECASDLKPNDVARGIIEDILIRKLGL